MVDPRRTTPASRVRFLNLRIPTTPASSCDAWACSASARAAARAAGSPRFRFFPFKRDLLWSLRPLRGVVGNEVGGSADWSGAWRRMVRPDSLELKTSAGRSSSSDTDGVFEEVRDGRRRLCIFRD